MRYPALFLFAAATLITAVFAQAETPASGAVPEYSRASLVERTPFSKNEKGFAKPASGGPLELRGFYGTGDKLEVSLTKPDTRESSWVKVGDSGSKWPVDAADPVAGTADVRYDGLRLHLTLARPEAPSIVAATPAPETKAENPDNRGRPRGNRPNLSPEARAAMRAAMHENMETARKEHPEYFDGSQLTDEQQKARGEYFRTGFEKARSAVAKVAPEEAAKLQNFGRGDRGGSEQGATDAPRSGGGFELGGKSAGGGTVPPTGGSASTPAPANP